MTKYYIDKDGVYIGGFDGAEPPVGAIEVPHAPEHASDIWVNGSWQRQISSAEFNAPIIEALIVIDSKSIRALREGDATRIASLEAQAAALRLQLRKD